MTEQETIIATVDRVRFRKDDSKWTIAKCDIGIVKGVIGFDIEPGSQLKLTGQWQTSEFNGANEFCFRSCQVNIPTESRELLHLVCLRVKGLGDAAESAIWDKYGDTWQDTDRPEIKGMTEAKAFEWRAAIARLEFSKDQDHAISFLLARGCTVNLATSAWQKWQKLTVSKVNENCYVLADVKHYGFKSVDEEIRSHFGIGDDDPRRAVAAIRYALAEAINQGPTAVNRSDLARRCLTLGPSSESLHAAFDQLKLDGAVKVIDEDTITSERFARHEVAIYKRFTF